MNFVTKSITKEYPPKAPFPAKGRDGLDTKPVRGDLDKK